MLINWTCCKTQRREQENAQHRRAQRGKVMWLSRDVMTSRATDVFFDVDMFNIAQTVSAIDG